VVNPVCKKALNAFSAERLAVLTAEAASTLGERAIKATPDYRSVWENRPESIRNNYITNRENRGNQDLHYLLGMIGLTWVFNDHPDTTLEMVKTKFNEAIELAKMLEI
jgi:hypothetical protein